MGLFDFFKKPVVVSIDQNIGVSASYVSPEYEKSRILMKEATAKSATDIHGAVLLLEEAIKICPENADHFKLASYYHKSEQKDKSYAILEKLLSGLNKKDIGMYHMNASGIYEKFCTLLYKDNRFDKYLFYYALWLHDRMVAMAFQGRKEELKNFLSNNDKLEYLAPTKVKGSFKKMNKENVKPEFNQRLNNYFVNNSSVLIDIASKAHTAESSSINNLSNYRMGETFGERTNRVLSKDEAFINQYNRFTSLEFKEYFEKELKPLIATDGSYGV